MFKYIVLLIALCLLFTSTEVVATALQVPVNTCNQTNWIAPASGWYNITASGVWHNGGWLKTDAAGFEYRDSAGWIASHIFEGAAVGQSRLLINYELTDWGEFHEDHIYTLQRYVNQGDILGFSVADTYPLVDPRTESVMYWFSDNVGSLSVDILPVPEPSSVLTLLCGLSGLSAVVYRKRR